MDDFSYLDAVSVPVIVLEASGADEARYVFCNATSYALTGLTPDDMLGRTAVDVFGKRLGEAVMQNHLRGLAAETRHVVETILPTAGGDVLIRQAFRPLPTSPRRVIGTTISSSSLSAEANALDAAARDAEQEIKLAASAHALRGPMRNFRHLMQELKVDFTDLGNGKLEIIEELEVLGDWAYDFLRDVLKYTRAIAGARTLPERVALQSICQPIFALSDPDDRHGLTCKPQDLLIERSVIEYALRNTLGRLLSQGARVEASVAGRKDSGGRLAVEIAATGLDCPVSDMKRDMSELTRILHIRGGRLEIEERPGGVVCRIVLPGRVIAESKTKDGPPIRRAASA